MEEIHGSDIKLRIQAGILVSLFLTAIFVAYTIVLPLTETLKDAERRGLHHSTIVRSMALSQWYFQITELTNQISSRSAIRMKQSQYLQGDITFAELQRFVTPKLQDALNYSDKIAALSRYTPSNRPVATLGKPLEDSLTFFHESPHTSRTISDPLRWNDTLYIGIHNPIIDAEGKTIGYDRIFVSMQEQQKILEERSGIGDKSSVLLFRRLGDSVYFPLPADSTPWNEAFFSHVAAGNISFQDSVDTVFTGEKIIADRHYFGNKEWGIAVVQDKHQRYKPVQRRLQGSIMALMIILAGFYALITYLLSPLTRRILLRNRELQKRIEEEAQQLHETRQKISTLRGMLPICANCKKIRDDSGYWSQVEEYVSHHADVSFSHSLCPDCLEKIYPDLNVTDDSSPDDTETDSLSES
ncbi:MAG: hypothetical protein ACQEQV_10590 [Fibrobacterota bacterium]